MKIYETTISTPLGKLRLLATENGLRGIYYQDHKNVPSLTTEPSQNHPILSETERQLAEYFAGSRRDFDLSLDLQGTPFMLQVWQALGQISFGTSVTYGELARDLGNPKASRAVGRANGLNPVSIVLPCHRVVGSNGKLTGYAGGLDNKEWLLKHEQSVSSLIGSC
ncbi:MAG: methylated-DNA--[protein]-cysteine S-methyltransferase [Candidatus Eremiobacteraeota bacterium]|nr:methylated-DNA--[protein]-cysteine S-methyltransferase [Candidatus Eremiobacteraeota bacterium]